MERLKGDIIIDSIKNSKEILSGIAILLIILCHAEVVVKGIPVLKVFIPGFIGVDIFMFYSGYSLGYSFTKRSLKDFYLQRIRRVYPMFAIFSLLTTIIYYIKGVHIGALDCFANLTSLSYYGIGGFPIDWYLSSLFLFYLFYPLVFLISSKAGWWIAPFLALIVMIILALWSIHDYYGSPIARIPIFTLGVLFFINQCKDSVFLQYIINTCLFIAIGIASVLISRMGYYTHGYFLTDMVTPLFVLLLAFVLVSVKQMCFVKEVLSSLGVYSLEIYVANFLSMGIMRLFINNYINSWGGQLLSYVLLNLLLSGLLIVVNKYVSGFVLCINNKANTIDYSK